MFIFGVTVVLYFIKYDITVLRWLPTVLGLCRGNPTREINSATRNTRGRRCTRGGFFKIAS